MTTLVVGASGATGRLLTGELLERGQDVRVIVRSLDKLPDILRGRDRLAVTQGSVLDFSDAELARQVDGCDAVASCLGHNMSLAGMYGHPRRLVTDATRRLCNAIAATKPIGPTKFVLMNSAGNSNRDLHEPVSLGQRFVIGLIRMLLPPHVDNEQAADYLRIHAPRGNGAVEWSVVRPDNLIDQNEVSDYVVHSSPARNAIFDPGTTSRINVASFMADLITDDAIWNKWKGRMPVIYNINPRR